MFNAALTSLRNRVCRVPWLPGVTAAMFVSRTRAGRSMKLSLFVIGAVMPLGSLIWAALMWHGARVMRDDSRQAGER